MRIWKHGCRMISQVDKKWGYQVPVRGPDNAEDLEWPGLESRNIYMQSLGCSHILAFSSHLLLPYFFLSVSPRYTAICDSVWESIVLPVWASNDYVSTTASLSTLIFSSSSLLCGRHHIENVRDIPWVIGYNNKKKLYTAFTRSITLTVDSIREVALRSGAPMPASGENILLIPIKQIQKGLNHDDVFSLRVKAMPVWKTAFLMRNISCKIKKALILTSLE